MRISSLRVKRNTALRIGYVLVLCAVPYVGQWMYATYVSHAEPISMEPASCNAVMIGDTALSDAISFAASATGRIIARKKTVDGWVFKAIIDADARPDDPIVLSDGSLVGIVRDVQSIPFASASYITGIPMTHTDVHWPVSVFDSSGKKGDFTVSGDGYNVFLNFIDKRGISTISGSRAVSMGDSVRSRAGERLSEYDVLFLGAVSSMDMSPDLLYPTVIIDFPDMNDIAHQSVFVLSDL